MPLERQTLRQNIKFARFSPEVRSSYIERFADGPAAETYYFHERYLDPQILAENPSYRKTTLVQLVKTIWGTKYKVIELPEPLWLKKWPVTMLLALVAKFSSGLRGSSVRLVTYAIENGDPYLLFSWLPRRAPNWVRKNILCLATVPGVMLFDRIAFGTEGARQTYLAATPAAYRKRLTAMSTLIPPLPEKLFESKRSDAREVLFVGAFEARKGVTQLLEAWEQLRSEGHKLSLTMIGYGAQINEVRRASVSMNFDVLESPARSIIHEKLTEAKVVVLLSQPEGRWREQIGLPILEGIAHGCRIVTTDQTGIAGWLSEHGHIVIPTESDTNQVSRALFRAVTEDFSPKETSWMSPNGRVQAENWLVMGQEPSYD